MSEKPTIYIAGPMSGYPQYNFPAFDEARDELRENGWQVVSPADMDREHGLDPTKNLVCIYLGNKKEYIFPDVDGRHTPIHEILGVKPSPLSMTWKINEQNKADFLKHAMERDKAAIVNCDAVYLLEGWEKSEGVKEELEHLTHANEAKQRTTACFKQTDHPKLALGRPSPWICHAAALCDCINYSLKQPFQTLDSGEREEYETGAVRDTNRGKARFDLLPYAPLKRLAGLYERGAEKYDDNNWRKGIPTNRAYESALRHLHQANELNTLKRLGRVTDDPMASEDHLAAAAFNIMVIMQNEEDGVE